MFIINYSLNSVLQKGRTNCIYVPGNTNRVNANVIPCFPSKRYSDENNVDAVGIGFNTDEGERIESYPEQHYKNGVAKTNATSRMYKRTVRILKHMRNELIDSGQITDSLVSSFFIECLVYNVPNNLFFSNNYQATVRSIIAKIYNDMDNFENSNNYEEVSGLKWLFRGGGRTPADARLFMLKCWQYGGFN